MQEALDGLTDELAVIEVNKITKGVSTLINSRRGVLSLRTIEFISAKLHSRTVLR
jgi:hypothetical protein